MVWGGLALAGGSCNLPKTQGDLVPGETKRSNDAQNDISRRSSVLPGAEKPSNEQCPPLKDMIKEQGQPCD